LPINTALREDVVQAGLSQNGVVLDVALPDEPDLPLLTRSFGACLASAIEIPLARLPLPRMELLGAVARWRSWLAGSGRGLVPIADAAKFNWPGYWIALLSTPAPNSDAGEDRTAVLMFGTPSGVVLSPQEPSLLGRASLELPVQQGYVIANFDPALSPSAALPTLRGTVEAIAIAATATGPMRLVDEAQALAGRGLTGDRYAAKAGTFTPLDGSGHGYDLTLIQAEVLDDLVLAEDRRLGYAEARRNLVTRGVDLNALVGRRFRVGEAECFGQRLCEPCSHLERLTTTGVLRGLIHRGGLRADILTDGRISIASAIETIS
jgi:MOSC domain-containing protein YiiM